MAAAMIADVVLEGTIVRLRLAREDDLPHFQRWLNDPDVYQWLAVGVLKPPTWEDELAWWRRARCSEDEMTWSIETLGGLLLGSVTLHWTRPARSASFGIFVGDKTEWDKGYGGAAVRALVRHGFSALGLNRIGLNCDATNARAIRCYEKVGFRHEGVMREHRHVQGRFHDSVVMGLLKKEWSDV
jgi:RimJ/RimL family protein N-acetyltransferase